MTITFYSSTGQRIAAVRDILTEADVRLMYPEAMIFPCDRTSTDVLLPRPRPADQSVCLPPLDPKE